MKLVNVMNRNYQINLSVNPKEYKLTIKKNDQEVYSEPHTSLQSVFEHLNVIISTQEKEEKRND